MAILFVATMAMMFLIGRFYPMPHPYESTKTIINKVQPWKYRYLAAAILILLMIFVFVVFSPLGLVKG